MAIIVFGDSITNRANDTGGGWTSRLWNHAFREFPIEYAPGVICPAHSVIELGIGGDTIVGIEKRFEQELMMRLDLANGGNCDDVLVGVAVGVNDARRNDNDGTYEVDIDLFEKTYDKVVARLLEIGVKVFLVGLTPCDEHKTSPALYADNLDTYENLRIEMYNNVIKKLSRKYHVPFVDVYPLFKQIIDTEGPESILGDGLHPNERGHQLIADNVFAAIRSEL